MGQVKALIPLDGSRGAEATLALMPVVAALGTPYVRLIGVVDESSFAGLPDAQERIDRESRLVELYLKEQKAKLDDESNLIGFEVKTGAPADKILEAARVFEPRLILLATHGRSGIERWRLGSVADKVIRAAPCDVLLASPSTQHRALEGGSILLPLDGSKLAEQSLPVAMELKADLKATLHIVRVIAFPTFTDGTAYALEAARESAEAYLGSLQRQLGNDDLVYASPTGDPADELLKYSREHQIALTVMTTHGRTGFMRAALGSVTDRMLAGHCPVLIVKPRTNVNP